VASRRQHLTRAPIREAVLDVAFAPRVPIEVVQSATQELAKQFSGSRDIWEATVGFKFGPDVQKGDSFSRGAKLGVRFDSSDQRHVLQCRVNGFTFSRLAPYEDWKEVKEAAQPFWNAFTTSLPGCRATKLAVRYINSLRLPLPITDFDDYLVAGPRVPPTLPQSITSFFQQVTIREPNGSYIATVSQALEGMTGDGNITVLLDVDVHHQVDLALNSADVWTTLDRLRNVKNDIFFSHLTERAIELFV
jgi:uncharacterized protein (TIGR04255 family)